MTAREELGITGRFYNNNLENMHKSQKKKLEDEISGNKRDLTKIINTLNKWINENFYQELSLALRGMGKFRLATGYEHLHIDPKTWFRLLPETRNEKIKHFNNYFAKPSETYLKPSAAGKKPKKNVKRRANQMEPELFEERVEAKKIKTLKVKRTSKEWEVCVINYNTYFPFLGCVINYFG